MHKRRVLEVLGIGVYLGMLILPLPLSYNNFPLSNFGMFVERPDYRSRFTVARIYITGSDGRVVEPSHLFYYGYYVAFKRRFAEANREEIEASLAKVTRHYGKLEGIWPIHARLNLKWLRRESDRTVIEASEEFAVSLK